MVLRLAAFTGGVVFLHQFSVLPGLFWTSAAFASACLLGFFRRRVAAFFLCGVLWALGSAVLSLAGRLDAEYEGRDLVVEGRVDGLPRQSEYITRFDFYIDTVSARRDIPFSAKVRLSWYNTAEALRSGQRWRLKVRLKRPRGMFNPGGFDYEGWLFANGIKATGYVRQGNENSLLSREGGRYRIDYWRQRLDEEITRAVGDSDALGLLKALTIGVRHDIRQEQWDVLRRTGTAHLVAISGLHIGLVAAFAYFLGLRIWARVGVRVLSPPQVGAVASLVAALFYAALADFSVPTQRALIMVTIVMTGICLQRRLAPLRVLAWAMFVVVLYDPPAVLSAGFWLSYCAVAVIVYAMAGRLGKPGYWAGVLRIHWTVFLGLAPVLLLFFQQISVLAPLANFVAVPLVSLLVVPACLAGALSIVVWPAAGKLLFAFAASVLAGLWGVMEWLAELPFAQIVFPEPPTWTILLAVMGGTLFLAPRGIPGRWLGAVLLLPAFSLSPKGPQQGEVFLTVLDVGQGLAAFITTENHVLVFDTGARFSDDFDMGSAVVGPFLRARGVNRIDALLVSHGDNDHIGGAATLLRGFPVTRVYSGAPDKLEYPAVKTCVSGQRWSWDGVRFEMLSPPGDSRLAENDRSCVLQIFSKFGNVLLSGDIEKAAEQWLVRQYGNALASDVIVVPHHGSDTSSTESFLQAVSPRFALIPAGHRNRYGFPKSEVVRRYQKFGSIVLNTADAGAISIELRAASETRYRAYRQSHGKFWNPGARK
ncbi:MAG: DNA internalization-related competence protein ComEC/Rec2 [Pseudomonadota bacterium]